MSENRKRPRTVSDCENLELSQRRIKLLNKYIELLENKNKLDEEKTVYITDLYKTAIKEQKRIFQEYHNDVRRKDFAIYKSHIMDYEVIIAQLIAKNQELQRND